MLYYICVTQVLQVVKCKRGDLIMTVSDCLSILFFIALLVCIVDIETDLFLIRKSMKKFIEKEEKKEYKEKEDLKEALKTFLKDY